MSKDWSSWLLKHLRVVENKNETEDFYEQGIEPETNTNYFNSVDCFLMGLHTYEHAEELAKDYSWVYGDVPTIVLSKRKLVSERKSIQFFSGDLKTLVEEKLKPSYKTVWAVGGPQLTKSLIELNLATGIKQTILPILLGEGKLFYEHFSPERKLHLNSCRAFKNGLVELGYDLL